MLSVGLIGPAPAQADSEVIAAARAIIEAANAGDRTTLDELGTFHSRFHATGGLLQIPRDSVYTSSTGETDSD